MSGLVQVQTDEQETRCSHCGAEVAHDQRYCLSCGRPCTALRSPLIDLLQHGSAKRTSEYPAGSQSGHEPTLQGGGPTAPLQRYAGLFSLMAMLLLASMIGLLIGHWAIGSGEGGAGKQLVRVEGLGGAVAPTAAATTASTTTSTSSTAGAAKEIEHETKQEERETAATNLAKPVKPSAAAQRHLSKLTGRKYEQEINKLANGPAPIETGG